MVVMSKFCESCGREFAPVTQEQRACNRMCGLKIRTAKGPKEAKLPAPITRPAFLVGEITPACAGEDPEIFFPEHGRSSAEAKAVCSRCPLKGPCGRWARAQNSCLLGIWAGTTWSDRNRRKR